MLQSIYLHVFVHLLIELNTACHITTAATRPFILIFFILDTCSLRITNIITKWTDPFSWYQVLYMLYEHNLKTLNAMIFDITYFHFSGAFWIFNSMIGNFKKLQQYHRMATHLACNFHCQASCLIMYAHKFSFYDLQHCKTRHCSRI